MKKIIFVALVLILLNGISVLADGGGGGGGGGGSDGGTNTNVDVGNTPGDLSNDGRSVDGGGTDNWGNEYANDGTTSEPGDANVRDIDDPTSPTTTITCNSSTSAWSACSATACGTSGTQTRTVSTCMMVYGDRNDYCDCYTTTESRTCSAPICPPSCSASCGTWSSWSACSATTCGTSGTQTRTQSCTRADCSTYTNTGSQTCYAPACCVDTSWDPSTNTVCSGNSFTQTSNCSNTRPATGTMNPGCGSASNYCVGDGYNNGCYWCSGTKTDTSWSPDPSTVCSGETFTQYGNNGCGTRIATGTKICSSYCDTASNGGYSCDGNTRRWFSAWCSAECLSGSCGCWLWSYSCNPQSTNCGTDSCNDGAGAPEHEYCQGGNVWSKYDGNLRGCAGTSCYNNHTYCSHYEKEVCETGYICEQINADNAECVPKSSTWTEV